MVNGAQSRRAVRNNFGTVIAACVKISGKFAPRSPQENLLFFMFVAATGPKLQRFSQKKSALWGGGGRRGRRGHYLAVGCLLSSRINNVNCRMDT